MQPKTVFRILIIFLSAIAIFISAVFLIGYSVSAPVYKGEALAHFNGKQFKNPSGIEAKGFGDVFKFLLNRQREPWAKNMDLASGPAPESNPDPDKIKITFVNHSTFLIQYKGLNILTDPVWSQRTSPFQFAGPERMRPPGINFEDLPKIDLIIISHNHYDHLDANTMKKLAVKFNPKVISPLGVSAFVKKLGFDNTIDLDWWEISNFQELKITSVPAQHFSGRGMFDRNATLWAGYVIQSADKKIYFAGDSGYDKNIFREIGRHFDSMDVSMIPIGAYKPRWFMSVIHVDPKEALLIHKDVNSKQSIAMHFGTFPLADDGQNDPIKELNAELLESNIEKEDFIIPKEGEGKYY